MKKSIYIFVCILFLLYLGCADDNSVSTDLPDPVHYNEAGAAEIAKRYFDALVPLLGQ